MSSFLLTWNPERWEWDENHLQRCIRRTRAGKAVNERWSLGIRRHGVTIGDRAYLLRQRTERGLVGSGTFTSDIYTDDHWDGSGRPMAYADIMWDAIVDPDDRLPVEVLHAEVPQVAWDRLQGSGVQVPPAIEADLWKLWGRHVKESVC